jgi:hypothetical protein
LAGAKFPHLHSITLSKLAKRLLSRISTSTLVAELSASLRDESVKLATSALGFCFVSGDLASKPANLFRLQLELFPHVFDFTFGFLLRHLVPSTQ